MPSVLTIIFATQVSENGAVIFGTRLMNPPQTVGPSLLPMDAEESLLVSPFWTDYNYASGGTVRFETYDNTNPGRVERIRLVSEFIMNRTRDLEDFDASWMILVEWRDCVPKGSNSVSNYIRPNLKVAKIGTKSSKKWDFWSKIGTLA